MIEKVNPAHPDKIADRIAGALVDYAYSVQSNPRIAVEALIGHRVCHIIAETSVHIPATFVQDTVTRIAGEGVVVDWVLLYYVGTVVLNMSESVFWKSTLRKLHAVFKCHCEHMPKPDRKK